MKFENIDGWGVFSELKISDDGGIRLEYFSEKYKKWVPCCVFPTLDENAIFAPSDLQSWTRGTVMEGSVMKRDMPDDKIFWNYFINFAGLPENKNCKVRKTVFENSGAKPNTEEMTVCIDPGSTLFLNNWEKWDGAAVTFFDRSLESRCLRDLVDSDQARPNGWTVDRYREGQKFLTIYGKEKTEPIYYSPDLSGSYELYICVKENICEFMLELPGVKYLEKVWFDERVIPAHKFWKEIHLGKYSFAPGDRIGIHQAAPTVHNKLREFGDVCYFKLVQSRSVSSPAVNGGEIVFYSEPYSIAYYYELQNEKMVESLVEEYVSCGVDKIVCQMGRGGSYVIYPSEVVKTARKGVVMGDDKQQSSGVAEMTEALDIMKVLPRYCRKKGIKFIANIGINSTYPGSTLESVFSAEHPEYHHPEFYEFLDYTIPAVREYAVDMLMEMADYEIDGLSVDHCRYPYAQTAETIVEFHRLLVQRIGQKRRSELELNIRFPVNNPEYYQALKILLEEDLVDTIIPSRFASIYPEINIADYVKLAAIHGKKVYGCLDFNTFIYTEKAMAPRPAEFQSAAERYRQDGADGLFFYQSEMVLRNVFQRKFVKSLKG